MSDYGYTRFSLTEGRYSAAGDVADQLAATEL